MTKREILETMRAHLKTMRRKCAGNGQCLYRKDGLAEGYGVEKCLIGALLPDEIAWPLYNAANAAVLLECFLEVRPYLWPDGVDYENYAPWAYLLTSIQYGHDDCNGAGPEVAGAEFPELVRAKILEILSARRKYIDPEDAALACQVFGDDEWRACDAGLS